VAASPLPIEPSDRSIEPDRRQSRRRFPLLLVFSLGLASVLLYFTLRGLDWVAFWNTIKNGHYAILLVVIPISSINYFIRSLRWSTFMRSEKKVSVLSVFWANMVGYLGNAYLPARAGELIRSAFLGEKSKLGTSFILATALVERILDAVTLVLVGSIALLLLGNISPSLTNAVRIMALAGILGLIVIIAAPLQEKLIQRLFGKLPLPPELSQSLSKQTTRFLVGMRSLQNWKRFSTFMFLTAIIWLLDALGTTIGVQIISQKLNIGQALVLLSALGLSSAVPSTPGYVGVYQFVAVTILVPFGFSRSEALAYILVSQILGYLVVSFWGLLGLWQLNKSKRFSTIAKVSEKTPTTVDEP
jgi:uncharacterized protein (TIRG00374 family)